MKQVMDLQEITLEHLPLVGGKNASLGEMINKLSHFDIQIPPGFATTTYAYQNFLHENKLTQKIAQQVKTVRIDDVAQLKKISSMIRHWIEEATLPVPLVEQIRENYRQLKLDTHQTVAVRSSATTEDLNDASFAGQQESYLNVHGEDSVLQTIKKVYSSLYSERAIAYRIHQGFDHEQVAISVGIQQMIRSDMAASGVIFTLDTESGFDEVIFITSSYGLGEAIVQGLVNPDEFYVHKNTLKAGKSSIINRKLGSKNLKMVYAGNSTERVKTVEVSPTEKQLFSITNNDILALANYALIIEKHYGKPMDIEWAKDGINQKLYILQARPETVKAREQHQVFEQYRLLETGKLIISGRSIGQKIGHGIARLVENPKQMDRLAPGEILVTDKTDPDWEPIMKRAAGIITNRGGRTCHAAIVARELGIPAIVGCNTATTTIPEGELITVSCAEGETGLVYSGKLNYQVERTPIESLPPLPINICINLANPEQAFTYQFLPNHGIGLARLEFIIGNMIGIHPNALLQPEKLTKDIRLEIEKRTAAYASPIEFYIEKLSEGIAIIAAAFYPKPVIVRFSDFKSNEYANLLGGDIFEPHEENPMLGYRGASRYLSGSFRECFASSKVRTKGNII